MAKKTVLKRVLKYAPLKTEFVRAVVQDDSIKEDISDEMYAVPATVIEMDGDVVDENENQQEEKKS